MSEKGKLTYVAVAAGLAGIAATAVYRLYEESKEAHRPGDTKGVHDEETPTSDPSASSSRRLPPRKPISAAEVARLHRAFKSVRLCGAIESIAGEEGFREKIYGNSAALVLFQQREGMNVTSKIVYHIFTFVELQDAVAMQRVCTSWRKFCSNFVQDRRYLRSCALRGFRKSCLGKCWILTSARPIRSRGAYEYLVDRAAVESVEEKLGYDLSENSIVRDLARTLPNHDLFKEGNKGQEQLFNILKAYVVHDKAVGYVQGMNFLAAILMTNLSEEESFWLLDTMMTGYDLRSTFLRSLPRLKMSLFQFEQLMTVFLPDLSAHFRNLDVHPIMFASEWFMTLFAYSLPQEFVERIWGMFFVDGWPVIHSIGLAILHGVQDKILPLDFDGTLRVLKTLESSVQNQDVDTLVATSCNFDITPAQLDDLQRAFIEDSLYLDK